MFALPEPLRDARGLGIGGGVISEFQGFIDCDCCCSTVLGLLIGTIFKFTAVFELV